MKSSRRQQQFIEKRVRAAEFVEKADSAGVPRSKYAQKKLSQKRVEGKQP